MCQYQSISPRVIRRNAKSKAQTWDATLLGSTLPDWKCSISPHKERRGPRAGSTMGLGDAERAAKDRLDNSKATTAATLPSTPERSKRQP